MCCVVASFCGVSREAGVPLLGCLGEVDVRPCDHGPLAAVARSPLCPLSLCPSVVCVGGVVPGGDLGPPHLHLL